MIIETPRLHMRELTIEDADFVFKLVNEPSFLENIGDKGVRNLEDARQFILEGPWTSHRERGYGEFLVELKEGGDPIGLCGLLFRESLNVSDIGCAFLPKYWRRGYAYEAACAVMEYGRSTLGISEENLASIKMLEKLGMSFERTVKMSDDDPGTALYS